MRGFRDRQARVRNETFKTQRAPPPFFFFLGPPPPQKNGKLQLNSKVLKEFGNPVHPPVWLGVFSVRYIAAAIPPKAKEIPLAG